MMTLQETFKAIEKNIESGINTGDSKQEIRQYLEGCIDVLKMVKPSIRLEEIGLFNQQMKHRIAKEANA